MRAAYLLDAALRYLLEKDYKIVAKGKVDDAIMYTHEQNAFNPVTDYLDTLTWDGPSFPANDVRESVNQSPPIIVNRWLFPIPCAPTSTGI